MKYSEKKAQENGDQFMKHVSHGGAFINTNRAAGRESVISVQKRVEASKSVGMLRFDGYTGTGTCFRVGQNKIMTALHVIQMYLNESKLCES